MVFTFFLPAFSSVSRAPVQHIAAEQLGEAGLHATVHNVTELINHLFQGAPALSQKRDVLAKQAPAARPTQAPVRSVVDEGVRTVRTGSFPQFQAGRPAASAAKPSTPTTHAAPSFTVTRAGGTVVPIQVGRDSLFGPRYTDTVIVQ